MSKPTTDHAGATILTFVALRVLIALAGEYLFFWYVMVREVVYLRASLLPITALLLSGACILAFVLLLPHTRSAARSLAYVSGSASMLAAATYVVEGLFRGASLREGQAWMGIGLAAAAVGTWVGVSVVTWMLTLECVRSLVRRATRAHA